MSVLVSINCITYNHEKYIEQALKSFLMQKTNFEFEIIIHDDASSDNTAKIIRAYEMKYPHIIKAMYQKENQFSKGNVKISYNYNIPRSRGKYIAICEGDDFWSNPYKLQKQVDYMEKNRNCGLCFHATKVIDNYDNVERYIKPYKESCVSPTRDIILGGGGFISTNSIMYRKELMDNVPSFYLASPIGDYPLQILASTRKYAYYINDVMSVYRFGVQGSFTDKMRKGENVSKKMIDVRKKTILMLDEFNVYSDYIYDEYVKRRKLKLQLQIFAYKWFYNIYGALFRK